MNSLRLSGLFLLILLISSGCTPSERARFKEARTKPFSPTNAYSPTIIPSEIRRVVVLPTFYKDYPGGEEDFLNNLDDIFKTELNKTLKFEVVNISRLDLQKEFGQSQFNSTGFLPNDFFEKLAKMTGAQAVVFTDITNYRPYSPLSVGVRSKLVEINSLKILWAFDTVFDAGNPHVAASARKFHKNETLSAYPLNSAESVLQSPLLFSKYAANATYSTLPPASN